jgi:peptidoglycan/xylan/chitin deacetylase (PgdA/CDA1 family)
MRRVLRQTIIALFHYVGLIRLYRFVHRRKITILAIHGVMDADGGSLWEPMRRQLSRRKLEEYLRVLSKYYRFVSLPKAVEMLEGRRPLEPYSLVVTFDDGYRNNFTHALPILKRYNAMATFFVTAGFVDNPRPFWFDRLDYALQQVSMGGRELEVGSLKMAVKASSRDELCKSYRDFRRAAKRLLIPDGVFVRDVEQLAAQLEAESGRALGDFQQNDDWSAIVTWQQLKEASVNGIEVGSHTVDHVRLGLVDADVAYEQLAGSKQLIEQRTGRPCHGICFPSGSFKDETIHLARETGYAYGITTISGRNRRGDDVMTLRRIGLPLDASWQEVLFRLAVSGR